MGIKYHFSVKDQQATARFLRNKAVQPAAKKSAKPATQVSRKKK